MNILNVGYDSTNYYLLEIRGGKLLVDSGWPGSYPKFLSVMKRKGISIQEIRYHIATHFHPDHAGLAQDLKNTGSKLILMESQPDYVRPMEKLFEKKKIPYHELRLNDNILLNFNDSRRFLSGLGLDGEILHTPGHSPDSVTLILDEGFAFTGDLHAPELEPDVGRAAAQDSWKRIHEFKIIRIYPGHGN